LKRRLLGEAVEVSSGHVDSNDAACGEDEPVSKPGPCEPHLRELGSFSEETSNDGCVNFEHESVSQLASEPEDSNLSCVSEHGSVSQLAGGSEANDLGCVSEHESVNQPASESERTSDFGFIPSSLAEHFDEAAGLSPSATGVSDSRFYDAVLTGSLIFDCDTCLKCRCILCSVCVHSGDGFCVHCENGLSDNFSDCSDAESFFSCFEKLDDESPEEYQEVLPEDDARNLSIKRDLVDIALKHHLTHAALRDILLFCRKYQFGDMPRCASTLLKTSHTTVTREVNPGEYWHNGVTKCVLDYVKNSNCSDVEISFSVDGVPIANSANTSFWPICCSFNRSPEVHLIGCYCGHSKPDDPNEYLREFVDELKVFFYIRLIVLWQKG